jgi:hypothetical protein
MMNSYPVGRAGKLVAMIESRPPERRYVSRVTVPIDRLQHEQGRQALWPTGSPSALQK